MMKVHNRVSSSDPFSIHTYMYIYVCIYINGYIYQTFSLSIQGKYSLDVSSHGLAKLYASELVSWKEFLATFFSVQKVT